MRLKRIGVMALFLCFFVGVAYSAEAIARVTKIRGEVKLKHLNEATFSAVKPGVPVFSGDAIAVGEKGFCMVIFLDDKSILKIREATQFQFIDTENTRTIDIEFGKILSDVKKERTKDFRVETPVSVASVKGTQFWSVINKMGFDKFYGLEGEVEIFNTVTGQSVALRPGQMVLSTSTGQIVSSPADPEEIPKDPELEEGGEEKIEEEVKEKEIKPEEAPEEEQKVEEVEKAPEEEMPEEEVEEAEEFFEEEAPEGEAAEAEAPEEPAPTPPKPFGMGLGIGSATLDGVIYNQFALRPEFRIGKLGIGLDLVLYVDNEGNVRKDEWDEASDVIDKFLYVRWGEKSDPFWFKVGSLEGVTLGYGGLLSGYSNMMEYPSVRRVGLNAGVNARGFGGEVFLANVKDFSRGGTLLGLRGTYTISEKFPLTLGVNLVTDINQFSGLKDRDDDSYPDIFDDFPDSSNLWNDTDGDGIPDPEDIAHEIHVGLDSSRWDIDADGDNVYDPVDTSLVLKPPPFSIEKNKSTATGFAFDIGYPVLRSNAATVVLYTEMNRLSFPSVETAQFKRPERSGTGITIPGIRATLFKLVNLSLEYRIKKEYFVPQFFDQAYDVNRVVPIYTESGTEIFTKDMLIFEDSSSVLDTKGYFGSANFGLFNLANFTASYANMVASDSVEFNSFFALITINPENIPTLSEATAYYQHNNDDNPFKISSVNTVLGYRLGYEVSKGVSLVWDFKQFYRDTGTGLEPVKQTTIETQFSF